MVSDTPSAYRARRDGGKKYSYGKQKPHSPGELAYMGDYFSNICRVRTLWNSLLPVFVILTLFGSGFYIGSTFLVDSGTGVTSASNANGSGSSSAHHASYIQFENQVKYLRGRVEAMEKETFEKIENLITRHQEHLEKVEEEHEKEKKNLNMKLTEGEHYQNGEEKRNMIAPPSLPLNSFNGNGETTTSTVTDADAITRHNDNTLTTATTTSAVTTTKSAIIPSVPHQYTGPIPGTESAFKFDMVHYGELNSPYDELSVTLTAWIYLDSKSKAHSMNTIFSNRNPGCDNHADKAGFSLYVNSWDTSDRQLVLEWGNDKSGCEKVGSGRSKSYLDYDQWTHVAVVLSDDHVALYMHGKEVAYTKPIQRKRQDRINLSIGRFNNGDFAFNGKISSIAIYNEALNEEDIRTMASENQGDLKRKELYSSHSSLILFAPLQDYIEEKKSKGGKIETKAQLDIHSYASGNPVDKFPQVIGKYHASSNPGGFTIEAADMTEYGFDPATHVVTEEDKKQSDIVGRERAAKIRDSMKRVWSAYREYAYGSDELKPQSLRRNEAWGGIGCTLVDSLDTLWLTGLKDEFWEARDWVRDKLTYAHAGSVSVFETTIRNLGGLLSAYELSKDEIFLTKAIDLGNRILPAFNTPTGIPNGQVNLRGGGSSNAGWTGGASIIAELGTLQVEFRYLSKHSGNPIYAEKANKAFDLMAQKHPANGLYPIYVNPKTGNFGSNTITFGALGDSFYEYMLKIWLQGGKVETEYRQMFDNAMDGVMKLMLKHSKPSNLLYISDLENGRNVHKMDHLACFLPAVLALGAQTMPYDDPDRYNNYMAAAKGLTHTCYQMYHRYPTHLAPEYSRFVEGKDMVPGASFYILRPEAVEAMFYMYMITGDPIYREWSWEVFEAIDTYCRTPKAYGAHPNVNDVNRKPDDRMESFFLAETMKYLYLIQDPDQPITLDKYVFNTEAHPLGIFDNLDYIRDSSYVPSS